MLLWVGEGGFYFGRGKRKLIRLKPEGTTLMLRRPLLASALAIVAVLIVLLLVSLAQGHKQLKSVQKELGSTNQQVVKLEKVIANQKTALNAVNEARTQL